MLSLLDIIAVLLTLTAAFSWLNAKILRLPNTIGLVIMSLVASLVMMIGLFLANGVVNAYMGFSNIGINLQSLPIVTVGVGFGIDYALYIVSRAVEEFPAARERLRAQRPTASEAELKTAVGR